MWMFIAYFFQCRVDGSNNSRIECIVTGTMETAPTDNTIRVLTSNITSALVSRQYTVLRSTATSGK